MFFSTTCIFAPLIRNAIIFKPIHKFHLQSYTFFPSFWIIIMITVDKCFQPFQIGIIISFSNRIHFWKKVKIIFKTWKKNKFWYSRIFLSRLIDDNLKLAPKLTNAPKIDKTDQFRRESISRIIIFDDSFSGRRWMIARDAAKILFLLFFGANLRESRVLLERIIFTKLQRKKLFFIPFYLDRNDYK